MTRHDPASTPPDTGGAYPRPAPAPLRSVPIAYVKRVVTESGSHWFTPATMRWFSSRTCGDGLCLADAVDPIAFVTSERRCFDDYRRCYTVRLASLMPPDEGDTLWTVDTVELPDGTPLTFARLADAKAAAPYAARGDALPPRLEAAARAYAAAPVRVRGAL